MDPELLKGATRGNKSLVEDLLARTEIAISASRDDALSAQDRGASVLLGVTMGGNTALHIAATNGHLELAQLICKRERSLLVARNVMLETPLHCAARAGHDTIVSFIVTSFTSEGEDDRAGNRMAIRARNRDEETALHLAVQNGHIDIAKELMSADPGLASMVDEQGISPLYLAVMAGSVALLHAILGSSSSTTPTNVSYAGPNGQTAMHAAAFLQNSAEIVEELLRRNQMLAKCADNLESTPLHYATSDGNAKMVAAIKPIWSAVAVMGVFINQCPNLDELLDNQRRILFHTAIEHKRIEMVQYVCRRSELVKLMNVETIKEIHLYIRQ
ncbi:uncharacterized protein [Typha angustifolia]|uniref:uncharacterized protein n=1 Tax=Typha angustifolia TaxID=59011 RepID=UPI003C2E8467